MKAFLILFLSFCGFLAKAQDHQYSYSISSEFTGTSNNKVPFWMRTNKFGAIPISGFSATPRGTIEKHFNLRQKFDWAMGFDSQVILGKSTKLNVIEAFIKARYKQLELKMGRSKDAIGIRDSLLSSGSFSVSGTSLGVPKIEASIPNYVTLPFLNNYISFKGSFSYGIIGTEPISKRSYILKNNAFTQLHQKSFYLQITKPYSKLKLSGGFNHNVEWGDENQFFANWEISPFNTAIKAISGGTHKQSKVGNHGGSIDQQLEYRFTKISIAVYHQFFYEVGGLAHLNNIKDGLFGLTIMNNNLEYNDNSNFKWNRILIEVFSSKSQGGELDARPSPSGDEDYYNNYLYLNGWRYKSENLGNNFITNKKYLRKELPSRNHESHGNNRLYLLHLGLDLDLASINVVSKMSFSRNYGTYATSPIGNSTSGVREIFPGPYFSPVNQFSAYLEMSKALKENLNFTLILSGDKGDLLYNSFGGSFRVTKSW